MSATHVNASTARFIAVVLATAAGCAAPRDAGMPRFEFSRLAMGVEARIVLHASSEERAQAAAEAAFAKIAALDGALSDWTATSAASHLCAHAGEGPVAVPPELLDVLATSLDMARRTGGAFDPTVGPLVALWRRARTLGRMPDPAEIARARALVGPDLVVIDRDAGTVELLRAGMQLDFGAIGKGYACQRAAETLAENGIESALVQMGGDLVCSAPPPGASGWSVALPVRNGAPPERLLLAHQALSTSGDTEQWIEIGGVRRSHVIDPRETDPKRGVGLTNQCLSIVIGPDGATTDALATAAGVLGAERGTALVARFPGCEARVEEDAGGTRMRRETAGFARLQRVSPEVP